MNALSLSIGRWWTPSRILLLVIVLFVCVQLAPIPMTLWEYDEPLFAQALIRYDPRVHHPPPPGYPVLVAIGKVANFFLKDPFRSLVTTSFFASLVGMLGFAAAFSRASGRLAIGLSASLLFYLSPAMLVHSTLPISDPAGLAFLSISLYLAVRLFDEGPTKHGAVLLALFAGLTVGCRPQYCVAILPMLLVSVWRLRTWRSRLLAVGVFTIVCLAWLVPMIEAVGGPSLSYRWLAGQGEYFLGHDSDISRGRSSLGELLVRFVAHPWGPKLLSLPLLALAALGAVSAIRARSKAWIPILAAGAPYLLFALAFMDPADAVRYTLPSVLMISFAASIGLARLAGGNRFVIAAATVLIGACSMVYVSSLIVERSTTASPPIQAIRFALRHLPADSIVAYELALGPHALHLLGRFQPRRIDEALTSLVDRPGTPLWLLTDGGSNIAGARTFSWRWSDAYGKLTRNHYRTVSLVPVQPERRYLPLSGVYASERTIAGEAWRWLDQSAELELPRLHGDRLVLTLSLAAETPFPTNELTVLVDDVSIGKLSVAAGPPRATELAIGSGARRVKLVSARSYVPAQVVGNRDPRRLSVKLHDLSTRQSVNSRTPSVEPMIQRGATRRQAASSLR
ncbi:MAG TPA: hypothetical protein VNM92_12940 [Thermoanaerobaculia bacterium]|nr:hypothetical protein [Thermoanaerobaculia bacterium]